MNPDAPSLVAHVAFTGLSAVSIACGYRVFRTDSMVRSAFWLLASFLNVGGVMVLLAAPYLGIALVFMMTVEMTVMAVFMVAFMMNPAGLNPMNMTHQPWLAAMAGVAVFSGGVVVALAGSFPDRPVPEGIDSVRDLGTELLGGSMLAFETAGVTILTAMLGAVVLSSRHSRYGVDAGDDGSLPPSLDPDEVRYPEGVLLEGVSDSGDSHDHTGPG